MGHSCRFGRRTFDQLCSDFAAKTICIRATPSASKIKSKFSLGISGFPPLLISLHHKIQMMDLPNRKSNDDGNVSIIRLSIVRYSDELSTIALMYSEGTS